MQLLIYYSNRVTKLMWSGCQSVIGGRRMGTTELAVTRDARESVLNQITEIVNRAPEIGSNVDTLD